MGWLVTQYSIHLKIWRKFSKITCLYFHPISIMRHLENIPRKFKCVFALETYQLQFIELQYQTYSKLELKTYLRCVHICCLKHSCNYSSRQEEHHSKKHSAETFRNLTLYFNIFFNIQF